MIPLFRVNDELDRDEVRWQIRSLREQGCGGVFSICECFRNGAPQKFISEWWWQAVEWIAEACADEGMEFWVYDDEDWPSGSIGGQLIEKHPETSWKYMKPHETKVSGPSEVDIDIPEGLFVAATAHRVESGKLVTSSLTNLSGNVTDGKLKWTAPAGEWIVTIYVALAGVGFFVDGYGDLMSRDAMGKFVDYVYEGHYRKLTDRGIKITGFFTDEPAISYSMIQWGERYHWYPSMPFTPELPKAFRERHGYDWYSNLPLLYNDDGKEALRFRCHHWETCCHLYSVNYFGQIYDFCEARGLKSSGHLVVEENFRNHLAQQGGNLPTHFRYMHIPGIDWIHPFESFAHLPSTTPKYATSMAHIMARPRTWCESFAAAGWGTTFQEMRRIVNWEHVNGINMQIPITYKYSLRGPDRAVFYCPGISYQQPWWDHFRPFADYEARMCVLASGLGHVAQVALAYPSVDIWSHCWDHTLLEERSKEYNALGDAVRAAGYDYDVLDDEALLSQSNIENGKIKTPTESFEVLIFPRMDAIRRGTLQFAKKLLEQGGTVIFTGSLPKNSFEGGSEDPDLQALLKEMFGERIPSEGNSRQMTKRARGKLGFAPTVDDAIALLKDVAQPDVNAHGAEDIYGFHRRIDDGELYFVFNNRNEARSVKVTLASSGAAEEWNAISGEITGIPSKATNSGVELDLKLEAHELKVVFLRKGGAPAKTQVPSRLIEEVALAGPFAFEAEHTMARPHLAWNFPDDHNGWTPDDAARATAPKEIAVGSWTDHGLPFFSGIGHYSTNFTLKEIPAGSKVMLSLGTVAVTASVEVNGKPAGIAYFAPYELDITSQAKRGDNALRVSVANTLSNHYAQYKELEGQPFNVGGDIPERRVSGLLGPVRVRVFGAA